MAETKPIDRTTFLELENMSLKLRIMRHNLERSETTFQEAAMKALDDAGLNTAEWGIDLDKGVFREK
jgi:hypothetical protein